MKKAINIRMDEDLLHELDNYAKELERPRTYLIEKAVSAYFDTLDEMISDKRIDDLKSGRSSAVSLEEVLKKAGIDV
ncbi:ribbon-helix-helix protein, CopG family [Nitratifractor sp.]|uniref:ribbon-helix-helix protein, CopG family n=1 Tax=Nitratifractor sp. TaxID=2268144 RepID=UPI0025E806EB|nr:ribbon-helix-helix protein, CopG family [Nitratifractor sp.]